MSGLVRIWKATRWIVVAMLCLSTGCGCGDTNGFASKKVPVAQKGT